MPLESYNPVANASQIENHPYCPQQEIVDFCKSKGIHITAYSPLGSTGSPLFKEEAVNELAQKHKVGAGTVLLSYHGTSSPKLSYPSNNSQSHVAAPSSPSPSRPRG